MQMAADQKEMDQAKAIQAEAAEAKATAVADLDGSSKDCWAQVIRVPLAGLASTYLILGCRTWQTTRRPSSRWRF